MQAYLMKRLRVVAKMKVSSPDLSLTQESKEKLDALNLTLRPASYRPVVKKRSQSQSNHIKCDFCDYKSTNQNYDVAHELQNHRGTKQKCPECDYSLGKSI